MKFSEGGILHGPKPSGHKPSQKQMHEQGANPK